MTPEEVLKDSPTKNLPISFITIFVISPKPNQSLSPLTQLNSHFLKILGNNKQLKSSAITQK